MSEFIGPRQDTLGTDGAGWFRYRPAKYPGFHPSVELLLNLLREGGLIGPAIRKGVCEVMQIVEALHKRGQRTILDIAKDLPFCPLDNSLDGAGGCLFLLRGVGIDHLER